MKNKNSQTSLKTVILWKIIKIMFKENQWTDVSHYLEFYQRLRTKNGIKYTVSYFKMVKLHITRYICGQPLYKNLSNVSVDESGWPKRFSSLKKLTESTTGLRILMTILSYNRSVVPTSKEKETLQCNYSTITEPNKRKFFTIPGWYIKQWVHKNGLKSSMPVYTDRCHFINPKSSPNGPSTFSSFWGWKSITEPIKEYMKSLMGDYWNTLSATFDALKVAKFKFDKDDENKIKYCGKLSVKEDPELKLRVFAMIDYYSQFALKPIHNILMDLLSKLPCDRTFTQDPKHSWSDDNHNYYSLDLSAATDRFPIHLQSKMLGYIFGSSDMARAWEKLLVDREFKAPNGKLLRYSVGQPMGAYSSWPAFTLCHHLVVSWAAKLSGYDNFTDYLILGDDIVIKNDKVASYYKSIIIRLGVEVSQTKTHRSKDTYEFAKRWIKGGVEITGVPLKGLSSHWNNIGVVYTMIFNYVRQLSIPCSPLDLICKIYNGSLRTRGKGSNKRNVKSSYRSIWKQLYDFDVANRFIRGELTNDMLRNYIISKWPKDKFFWLPIDSGIPLFVKGLLSLGTREMAIKSINSVWKSSTTAYRELSDEEPDSNKAIVLAHSPVMKGLLNHLYDLKAYLDQEVKINTLNFDDLINALRVEEVDKIVLMNRDIHIRSEVLNKLWVKSFKQLNNWPTPDQVESGSSTKELIPIREMTEIVSGDPDTYWSDTGLNTLNTSIADFEFLCDPVAWNKPSEIDIPLDLSIALNREVSNLTFLRNSFKPFVSQHRTNYGSL